MLLGIAVAICYIPLVTGAAVLTQWLLLGVVLPFMLRPVKMSPGHWLGLAFLGFACCSLWWTENVFDSGYALVLQWGVLGMAFMWGTDRDLQPVFRGLMVGLCVSVALAVVWEFGWRPLVQGTSDAPAGLFVAPNALGSALALAVVAALVYEEYWFVLPGAIGLALTNFRTGLVTMLVTMLVWLWSKHKDLAIGLGALIVVACIGVVWHKNVSGSLSSRLEIWLNVLPSLSWQGHGIGSFFQLYPTLSEWHPDRPEHAYNDFLEVVFELGLGGLLIFALLARCFEAPSAERLILLCFCEQALLWFPTSVPVSAFMAAIVAGRLSGLVPLHRDSRNRSGPTLSRWQTKRRFGLSGAGLEPVSVEPNYPGGPGVLDLRSGANRGNR